MIVDKQGVAIDIAEQKANLFHRKYAVYYNHQTEKFSIRCYNKYYFNVLEELVFISD